MTQEKALEDFFLKKKPVELLVQIGKHQRDNYASALASEVDVTYSHTVKCLQKMNREGLVEFEQHGRKKEVLLTDKGNELAEEFFQVLRKMTE